MYYHKFKIFKFKNIAVFKQHQREISSKIYWLCFPSYCHNIIRYCPKGSQKRIELFLLAWVEEMFFVFQMTFLCRTLFMQSGKIYHVGPSSQLFVHERTFVLYCFQDRKEQN